MGSTTTTTKHSRLHQLEWLDNRKWRAILLSYYQFPVNYSSTDWKSQQKFFLLFLCFPLLLFIVFNVSWNVCSPLSCMFDFSALKPLFCIFYDLSSTSPYNFPYSFYFLYSHLLLALLAGIFVIGGPEIPHTFDKFSVYVYSIFCIEPIWTHYLLGSVTTVLLFVASQMFNYFEILFT